MSILDALKRVISLDEESVQKRTTETFEKEFDNVDNFIKKLNSVLDGETKIDGTLGELKKNLVPIVEELRGEMERLSSTDAVGTDGQTRASHLVCDLSKLRLKLY